ncbi:MAG: 50S ribosomal protein L2 [Deltaproteobacteria bacterium RIFCSPLOWO2_02_FULL_47_10]|nr:MAG: 50S ribosomal protein L2 [Deltaproteobacteria bacterium RIFCSPLOWO2_02_FULL_47_10]
MKTYSSTSPGRRFQTGNEFSGLTKKKPEKGLVYFLHRNGGRNNAGYITTDHRGGGAARRYRDVDFKRDKHNVPGKVVAFEYDPNRSSRIALIQYLDGERTYIIAPVGLKVGDTVISAENAEVLPGNVLPLKNIPAGTAIHNIELKVSGGGKLVRSAGSAAQIMAKEGEYAQVRMPSGEVRLINMNCRATIGQVGNLDHENISLGKAGRSRYLGRRPHVRGMAMNPVDHPHGGGEGRSKGGNHPQSPTGVPAKGYKTRTNKRTQWCIIKDRRK